MYSYSKINLFEQCPHAFKLKYIDKVKVKREQTVEQFMGTMVHESLEGLYTKVMNKQPTSLFQIQAKLEMQWNKKYFPDKLVINDQTNYKQRALDAVEKYYNKHYPFEGDQTVAVEKKIIKQFDNFKLIGYVDRIEDFGDKQIIHDYKSGKHKRFDKNQLKMYHLMLDPEKETELVWHFVFLDEQEKIKSDIAGFENEISEKINKLESEKQFEKIKTGRCNWCIFKDLCD